MSKKKPPKQTEFEPPPFTAALDARVPAENVVLSHFVESADQWIAASEASDGRVFLGRAKTEPLARRAAGMRTFSYLEDRAAGKLRDTTPEDIADAKEELAQQLAELIRLVETYNGRFPHSMPQRVAAMQLRAAKAVVTEGGDRGGLLRWVLPPLLFLSGAFAEGVIGVYAEKAIDLITKLLAS